MKDKEEHLKALGRIGFILMIFHFAGVLQMYFLIPAVITGDTVGIIIGSICLWWLGKKSGEYSASQREGREEYEKKYGSDDK